MTTDDNVRVYIGTPGGTADAKTEGQLTATGSICMKDHEQEAEIKSELEEEGAMQSAEKENIDTQGQVLEFLGSCPRCYMPLPTNMKITTIPHFKDVVIMATNCDECGYRDNEIQGGGGIESKGVKIKLKLTDASDLCRDVLKSDTAALEIPEIGLRLEEGSLGGKFTTIEGLLTSIRDKLAAVNPFCHGDSSDMVKNTKMGIFLFALDQIIKGEKLDVHFILDDPAGNSFLQNIHAPDADPEMETEYYERDFEQNEMLGLNDMITENYEDS